ncbi:MAG TPA: saccharopine dehydrogenase NADP-binding domain-containing protein [Sphingomicrobium sp.]|nr:saccharopine dehydrogenase NADP-binding domain-containing protein [Sphingomicrobium sp.]
MKRVLIIGGYGNFGGYIARSLAADPAIRVIIGGRSLARAKAFAATLDPRVCVEQAKIDIDADFQSALAVVAPDVVVHTVGPFQRQDYRVARACIAHGAHYIDLADARAFVAGIWALDESARARQVVVISGASSVPCLTSAVVDHYLANFDRLETLDYGITAAQETNRGLATASAVLSYVGRRFPALRDGQQKDVYGWQDIHIVRYPELGRRLFGNCDVPDLEIFPERYRSVRDIRFAAGHEIAALHLATWWLSWLVRIRLLRRLDRFALSLLKGSFVFDRLGSSKSGMHLFLSGVGKDGERKCIRFFLIARRGHGPYVPCMPAILLARRLALGESISPGARPCLDLIDLPTYLKALAGYDISVIVEGADAPS